VELAKRIALPPGLTLDRYRKLHELFECICSTTAWNFFKVNLPAIHFTSMYLDESFQVFVMHLRIMTF
jgi:hypothetical protein